MCAAFIFKIDKMIQGIREQNHYKNAISALEEADLDGFQQDGSHYPDDYGGSYGVKSLQDKLRILEKELQKAREESFQAGYEEGKESSMQLAERRIEEIRQEMKELEKQYQENIKKIDVPLLNLAKKMALVILDTELKMREDHDEILMKQLRKMLYEVIDQSQVMIRVNAQQQTAVESDVLKQKLNLPSNMEITTVVDPDLKPGEAVVQTENYYVDGTFANQVDEIAEQLRDGENK